MAENENIADTPQEKPTLQDEGTVDRGNTSVNPESTSSILELDNIKENIADVIETDKNPEVVDTEREVDDLRNEDEECNLILDELMDSLDVVDSWIDTATDECPVESVDKTDETDDKEKENIRGNDLIKSNDNKTRSVSDGDSRNQKRKVSTSEGKQSNENAGKSSARSNREKKTPSKESSESSRNRNARPVNRSRDIDRTSRRERTGTDKTRDRESGSRRDRSAIRSNKPDDRPRRNTDRGVDRRKQDSKMRRSKSKERDSHRNSTKNDRRSHTKQTSKDVRYSDRNSSLYKKRDRSLDREKRSSKDWSSSRKEVSKPSSTAVTNKSSGDDQLKSKKVSPSPDVLVPPGTEGDLLLGGSKHDESKLRLPKGDGLVPPGTEDILLPSSRSSKEKEEASSSKKRKLSSSDSKKILKSSVEKELSKVDKERHGEKRRRVTSTEGDSLKEHCIDRGKIVRDQDRISRELSLERLREAKNRERLDRGRYKGRERFSPSRRLQEGRIRRSTSFGRRSSVDSRWDTSNRDRFRRRSDLSPISPGRMSRGSPFSFEFSPVSSRSSSRERLRSDYQSNKFRSYSPISSSSDLSRSLLPISSDDERESRSKRRRRLPFLDEMERKLGLKLTGGHNINHQLRTSRQFPMDPNIDISAPPPGIYPMNYPPPVHYRAPVPAPAPVPFRPAMNPAYPPVAPVPVPVRPFIPRPMAVAAPRPNAPTVPPVTGPSPANNSQPNSTTGRQLVSVPRTTLNFRFQRPIQSTPLPETPPPPTISAGAGKGEMSLSSLLEASVTVGGKNPVDAARLERCAVAIQTLQEDESFSMITLGRFVIQETADKSRYSSVARFNHPAQESMFKLKSPLLRNQLVTLKFTTPPVQPVKPSVEQQPATVDKSATTRKSSIWPKNSERKVEEKKVLPMSEPEDDDDDVCIVEKPETVVSISSDSDHDMNLSLVSDISDVSDDEADDKLENVSSEEEDFNNQCYSCAKCNQTKQLVDAFTQCENDSKNVGVQVDIVNQQSVGTSNVLKSFEDVSRSVGHSNTSSISSNSSNELPSPSPQAQRPYADPHLGDGSLSTKKHNAQSFLESVTNSSFQLSSHSFSQSSNPLSYKPFMNTANQFSDNNSPNPAPNKFQNQRDTISSHVSSVTNKPFQENSSLTSTQSYSGSTPFSRPFSMPSSGSTPGSLSKPDPPRGILKYSSSSSPATTPTSLSGSSFQREPFQSVSSYQGAGSLLEKPQSYGKEGSGNQQNVGVSSVHSSSLSQTFRSVGNLMQQPFQSRPTFDANQPQGPQTQPFRGGLRQQETVGRSPFQGGSGSGQSSIGQNQSFQSGGQSQQSTNSDFGNRFGSAGNRPAMVPPPNPTFSQQTLNRKNELYFGSTPRQQGTYFGREPY